MATDRSKLAHAILALLQDGAHSAFRYDADTSVDESDLVPEIGDELILSGDTVNDDGQRVRFTARIYIGPDDIEIEDWN